MNGSLPFGLGLKARLGSAAGIDGPAECDTCSQGSESEEWEVDQCFWYDSLDKGSMYPPRDEKHDYRCGNEDPACHLYQ